jgi:hypothetical protein
MGLYEYCRTDPVVTVDPDGQKSVYRSRDRVLTTYGPGSQGLDKRHRGAVPKGWRLVGRDMAGDKLWHILDKKRWKKAYGKHSWQLETEFSGEVKANATLSVGFEGTWSGSITVETTVAAKVAFKESVSTEFVMNAEEYKTREYVVYATVIEKTVCLNRKGYLHLAEHASRVTNCPTGYIKRSAKAIAEYSNCYGGHFSVIGGQITTYCESIKGLAKYTDKKPQWQVVPWMSRFQEKGTKEMTKNQASLIAQGRWRLQQSLGKVVQSYFE